MTSRDVLERFRQGEAAAWEDLVRSNHRLVHGVVSRWVTGPFEQEEAVQDVWCHVFEKRGAVDPARFAEFEGWLATVAQHRCIDRLRRARLVPGDGGAVDAEQIPTPPHQDTVVAERELADALAAFKARLKPAFATFFELHFVEGLSYAEIASRMSISTLRCRYMKRVLALRAQRSRVLMNALRPVAAVEERHAPTR